ncbi:hypothetical protein D3C72_603290 [compost metagenome]
MGRALKNTLRLLVGFIAAQPLEVNRTANDGLGDRVRHLRLRLVANVQHHGAHQIFKQGYLLRLKPAGTEEGFGGFNEVNFFGIFNVLRQRGQAKLHAGRRDVDIFVAVEIHGTTQ